MPGPGVPADELHSPRVGEDGGRNPEADDVGQRIELAAEFARSVGHARDTAVQPVQNHGETDGFGGDFEILRGQAGILAKFMTPWIERMIDR